MESDEKILICSIQNGNKDALNKLITEYYQDIFGYFYKFTNDYHQSKDLTQEVFIKMVVNIGKYKPKGEFKNWLFAIASNHLKNYWRSLSRKPEFGDLSEETPENGNEIDRLTLKSVFLSALNTLPKEQKEAIILRFYNNFTIKEISKITSVKEPTVKARIKYGIEKLKNILEE